MKELYGEGLATHADPESCAGSRKGAGEALTGAHAGRAIEPRKPLLLGADAVTTSGRQHDPAQDLRARDRPGAVEELGVQEGDGRDACVESPCARTGRSLALPSLMVRRDAVGRPRP